MVQEAAEREAAQEILNEPGAPIVMLDHVSLAFDDKEKFGIIFLGKRNQVIADEVQQTGTVDHTPVYPREVVKRALELSATAVILVHNHPTRHFQSRSVTQNTAWSLAFC